jgi:AraC family transcriptional regulator, transcriptional activator FtrA
MPAKRRPLLVVLVADQLSLFEFSAACDVFGDADDLSESVVGWYRFAIASGGASRVSADVGGVVVEVEHDLSSLREAHTIIVPPSVLQYDLPDAIAIELRRAHARGARIASLCTGAFVLARAGLLNGRDATTHWRSAARLAEQYPEVSVNPDVLYIDNGDIMTSAGSAASLDLCLHIVRKDFGAEVANVIARAMVIPPHRDGGQAQFVSRPITSSFAGDPFSDVLAWAVDHLPEDLPVELLAQRAAMSPRTFARKFREVTGTTPHQWLVSQRIFLAQRLLEATDLSVDIVAWKSGFGTATNLRMRFQKVTGIAPSAYRRTFRTAS